MKKALIFLLLASWANAQDTGDSPTPAPPPTGPLLNRAPKFSQWTLSYAYPKTKDSDSSPPSAPLPPGVPLPPLQATVTKTDRFYHELIVDTGHGKSEEWFDGTTAAFLQAGNPHFSIGGSPTPGSNFTDFSKQDFDYLDWISLKTFAGVKKVNGQDCLVFQQGSGSDTTTAYINAETRLPVRIESSDSTCDYVFGTPSVTSQVFPEEVQKALAYNQELAKKAGAYGSRPEDDNVTSTPERLKLEQKTATFALLRVLKRLRYDHTP